MEAAEFEQLVSEYYADLKAKYDEIVDTADNTAYAIRFCRTALLDHNPDHPFNSQFFFELNTYYFHFSQLQKSKAMEHTLALLNKVIENSRNALEQALLVFTGHADDNTLPVHYLELMQNRPLTLSDLIAEERQALKLTNDEAPKLLARYEAATRLFAQQLEPEEEEAEPSNHTYTFFRFDQGLVGYYLLRMAGLEPRVNVHVSTCAFLLHAIAREDFSAMNTSEIYKRLTNPLGYTHKKGVLKDLMHIRPYFQKKGLERGLTLVDADIKKLQGR